jgi:hypothetical protein
MDEKPPEIKWTLGRRRKNSPAKTPFEKKKSGKMESKINQSTKTKKEIKKR